MKMTLRTLCVELRPKMRLRSITLILRQQGRICTGTLVHPVLRNLRVSSGGAVVAYVFWDSQGVNMVNYLESHDKWCILCRRTDSSGDCEEKSGKLTRGVLLLQDNELLKLLWQLRPNAASRSSLTPSPPFLQI